MDLPLSVVLSFFMDWNDICSFSFIWKGITLREEILAGRNFGGFGGFVKNPPKSAKLTSRQN